MRAFFRSHSEPTAFWGEESHRLGKDSSAPKYHKPQNNRK